MIRTMILAASLPLTLAGAAILNASERHCSLASDWTFNGNRVLVERCTGKLGLTMGERIVARF